MLKLSAACSESTMPSSRVSLIKWTTARFADEAGSMGCSLRGLLILEWFIGQLWTANMES
jgi:hypothetical protein